MKRGKVLFVVSTSFVIFVFWSFLYPFILFASPREGKSCLRCHSKIKRLLSEEVVHSPVAKGKCSICHNPHTSKYKNLLYFKGKKECLICHKEQRKILVFTFQ